MIKSIQIKNFRCFESCEISFKDLTIAVGKNNAGKSTLIEALRIVSICVNRADKINYTYTPNWLSLDEDLYGISPSIENLDISTKNIFFRYGPAPAIIKTNFEDGASIVTYVGEDAKIFAALFDSNKKNIVSKKLAKDLRLKPINILPQISPLLREEPIIKIATVQKNIDTNLGSRNFRNQLKYYYQDFENFRQLAERTWRGLAIRDLENRNGLVGNLYLMVRDNNFDAEIGWMGHGLQMWLQTIWFLSRSDEHSSVILDEPDVYMHADLQRRLIRYIKGKYDQILIATHSVEIMAEVEPDNIMPVDSAKKKLVYANKAPFVQKIIEEIGSVHNLEIARMFSSKKFLIVEGNNDDIKILSIFQSLIFKDTHEPFDILPKTFVEGWGGWQRVIGLMKALKDNITGIKIYCIFDSDYHLRNEIEERMKDASQIGLNLHIWSKKEIENFLINSRVIHRILIKKGKGISELDHHTLEEQITSICESIKQEVIEDLATEIQAKNKGMALKTAIKTAREYIYPIWTKDRLGLIPGKKLISKLSNWTNTKYQVSLNAFKIATEFKKEEIPSEVKHLIISIEKGENLSDS